MKNEQQFAPEKIRDPFQLVAASLVVAVLMAGGFPAAARAITQPAWAAGLLVVAAIGVVLLSLVLTFVIQTRYRVVLQDNQRFEDHLARERRIEEQTERLKQAVTEAHIDMESLAAGALDNAPLEVRAALRDLLGELAGNDDEARGQTDPRAYGVNERTALEVGKALMAEHRWPEAAKYFDKYTEANPDDWEAQRSRGIAYAMSRQSTTTDLESLKAYNQAIALAPRSLDLNTRARLITYRAAMLKRLGRLQEAESDLLLAMQKATGELEKRDIRYNLAGVYALQQKRDKVIELVRSLVGCSREMDYVRRHVKDYFNFLADDGEFLALIAPDRQ